MLEKMGEDRRSSSLAKKELQAFIDSFPCLEEAEPSESEEKAPPDVEQSASCPPPLFGNLINYMKGTWPP